MILFALFAANAHAGCQLLQTPTVEGTSLRVLGVSEPLSCRRVTLRTKGAAPTVDVRIGKRKVPRDHILVTDNEVAIGLPELTVGQEATILVSLPGNDLEVILGTPGHVETPPGETHITWTVTLDEKHPGWGFADPKFASTRKEVAVVGPDGHRSHVVAGAMPQGVLVLDPGSFTLLADLAR